MTDSGPETWIYIASGIVFLLPCLLLYSAWRSLFPAENPLKLPTWRKNVVKVALFVAGVSTLVHAIWNASWLDCGGSPHGMGAGPGLWQSLGKPLLWSFGIALALSFFGKGKGRVLLLAWSVSMGFVFFMIYGLQFD